MTKPELLSPAGDFDSLKAAIYNGADAVYLGLGVFNARAAAANFNTETISEAVRFAHLYGVKVYITLNTIVANNEIPQLLKLATAAVEAKADAFIVQDMGVIAILKRCFPNICLHASTQMGINNLYGAKAAEQLGIKRVVLSRETKLKDIKEIKENTNLEIEFFVQGALCVAFSGNCYMSALENNNSGNRGRCLQLCRLPYSAKTERKTFNNAYLLSPADLCLIDNLKTLVGSGVSSFKIEGRLRRSGYVAEATECYRRAIDEGFPKANKEKIERLKKVFYRGEYIADAYLSDNTPNKIINKQYQNHIGVPIGEVKSVKPFKDIYEIEIKTKHLLATGDGIKFFDNGKQTVSMGVGNVIKLPNECYKVYGKAKPAVGDKVNLITDKAAEDAALARVKKLPLTIKIIAKENLPLSITAIYKEISLTQQSEFVVQTALNTPTLPNQIIDGASKLGDSVFVAERIEVDCGQVFIPKSVINDTRRALIAKLENAIICNAEKNITAKIDNAEIERIVSEAAVFAKADTDKEIYQSYDNGGGIFADQKIAVIYPNNYSASEVSRLTEEAIKQGLQPCLRLPLIASIKDIQKIEEVLKANKQITKLLTNNLYGFEFAKNGYRIIAGWGLNIYNNFALNEVISLGAEWAIESVEIKEGLANNNKVYKFIGKGFPLMTLAHCPYKTLNGNTCEGCTYTPNLKYKRENRTYNIVRKRLDNCYFELIED